MSLLKDVRSVTAELSTVDMLRFLITEKFPGKTAVTASLRAPSLVVLKMAADIDRAIPVVFCHPGHLFPESLAYRERIVDLLPGRGLVVPRGVWHRVLVDLLQTFWPGALRWLAAHAPPTVRLPLAVALHHQELGAEDARRAGCADRVVALIRGDAGPDLAPLAEALRRCDAEF